MFDALATLDWVALAVLTVSLLVGAWRGLVVEVISVLSWVAALLLAQWFAADVGARLPMAGATSSVRYVAGFAVLVVATLLAGALLGFLLSKLLSVAGMGPVNRLLGAMFGLLRAVLLILVATAVVGMTPWKSAPLWQASVGARWATSALGLLRPVLPQAFAPYLPSS